ncbi:MAG: hypothetical protein JO157_11625 [Acetobacteraceae bacterium]|nr:hypothetical protein [Acetobacteraceae bacterium]
MAHEPTPHASPATQTRRPPPLWVAAAVGIALGLSRIVAMSVVPEWSLRWYAVRAAIMLPTFAALVWRPPAPRTPLRWLRARLGPALASLLWAALSVAFVLGSETLYRMWLHR